MLAVYIILPNHMLLRSLIFVMDVFHMLKVEGRV